MRLPPLSRKASRIWVSLAAVSLFLAKLVHIYARRDVLQGTYVWLWGSTFFYQDTLALTFLRWLMDGGVFSRRMLRILTIYIFVVASCTVCFFYATGSEARWQDARVLMGAGSWEMLQTEAHTLAGVIAALTIFALVANDACNHFADAFLHIAEQIWSACLKTKKIFTSRLCPPEHSSGPYNNIASDPLDRANATRGRRKTTVYGIGAALWLIVQSVGLMSRPSNQLYTNMSWTLPLLPLLPLVPGLKAKVTQPGGWVHGILGITTSPRVLHIQPIGDIDWYNDTNHNEKPITSFAISNYNQPLLPELQAIDLQAISIKCILLLILESTRKDVFPMKRDGTIWQRLAGTWPRKTLSINVKKHLTSLTPFASFLTGETEESSQLSDVFPSGQKQWAHRGRINVKDAVTSSTFTLKSLVGIICGIHPITADWNVEYAYRPYQPCLPHILNHLNGWECDTRAEQLPTWEAQHFQSTTLNYDLQRQLMENMGFETKNIIGSEILREEQKKKSSSVEIPDVNYFGMPEIAIQDNLRRAFAEVRTEASRKFISHLTSTTHHDFTVPPQQETLRLAGTQAWESLSRYLNAVGYVDQWLGNITTMLEEAGIANDTLIIAVGDHGLPIVEQGNITPYGNPHIGSTKVPLVFSHPHLPPKIEIETPVTSLSILPTILDLLIQTGSLSTCEAREAEKLLPFYEAQSLLRPLVSTPSPPSSGNGKRRADWQFTVMSPGGMMVAVRESSNPHWRLIFPLTEDHSWSFTDLRVDPMEMQPDKGADLESLRERVRRKYGSDAAEWMVIAAEVTEAWVVENRRLWQFDG